MQIAVDSFVGAGGGWGRTEDVIPIVVDYCSPKKKNDGCFDIEHGLHSGACAARRCGSTIPFTVVNDKCHEKVQLTIHAWINAVD